MPSEPTVYPTREELITNLCTLYRDNNFSRITRDYYRACSPYSDRAWQVYWPTFGDFVAEADLDDVCVQPVETRSDEYTGNQWTVTIPQTRIHTLEQLLDYCEVDQTVWEVERFICNKWEMASKVGDEVKVEPLYQVKATLVKKTKTITIREEIESMKEDFKSQIVVAPYVCVPSPDSGYSLELLIPDLHAGKLAWNGETGHGDYDTRIAEETYKRAINTLLYTATYSYEFDEIMLGVGNDLLHTDNFQSTTTKGTVVDSDSRYQKTYRTVRRMLCDGIERLKRVAPVKVKLIPGNHDTLSNFTLGDSLECWFHGDNRVEIDNSPVPFKFYSWGDVLIMLTHGDKGKQADYGLWMATEQPELFGKSKFREIHIGHKHKTMVDEKFGVRVRTFSALCRPDAWHSENGFVGNLRSAEAIVWHKTQGRVAEFIHTEID